MKSTPGIPDVPGLDPVLHRTEQVRDHTGELRQWHLLDSGPWLAERGITPTPEDALDRLMRFAAGVGK